MEQVNLVKCSLPDSLSILDFYRLIGPLSPLLKDGHTSMNVPDELVKKLDFPVFSKRLTVLPDSTFLIDGTAKVIERINGIESREMLGEILCYCSGESLSHRMSRASGICLCSSAFFIPRHNTIS